MGRSGPARRSAARRWPVRLGQVAVDDRSVESGRAAAPPRSRRGAAAPTSPSPTTCAIRRCPSSSRCRWRAACRRRRRWPRRRPRPGGLAGAGHDGRDTSPSATTCVDRRRPTGCRPAGGRRRAGRPGPATASGSVRPSASSGRSPCSCSTGRSPSSSVDEPGVGQVVDDHADGAGAPLGEAARGRVGAVAELGHGLAAPPARRSSLTRGEFCSTSETSDFDTPARAATVRIVGGRVAAEGAPSRSSSGTYASVRS